ncbi:MAG: nidogen-like domain-containing protein, partial [Myxococcota bacterium]
MRIRTLCILGALAAMAGRAEAQAGLLSGLGGAVDFGEACLAPNDDGSSAEIDITPWFPSGLQFFDRTHRSVFVNTNGNISFSDSLSTFTPNAFPVANRPMIAPYWADVDIRDPDNCSSVSGSDPCRNPSENGVWWFGEPGRFVVTWHQVGYFLCSVDLRMNFQLIITQADNGCGGLGDFDVEFRYNRCEWETGDASGGTGGFGGTEAQAGFDAGNSRDFVEIPGSREPGIAESLCTGSNVGETGVWRFQIRRGTVTCPDAGEACETGELGACAEGRTACVGSGTECRSITPSTDEVCDNLDNDCDGNVDEGGDLCGGLEICDLGNCLDVCFEFGCPPGQTCTDEGRCIDDGCEDVECGLGERCSAGECVGACDDIVCPTGQTCIGGRCSDLCESIVCDEACQLCENGGCSPAW